MVLGVWPSAWVQFALATRLAKPDSDRPFEMIRSSVTIALVPEAKGGPFVFWDDLASGCAKAAELGFDGVEVFPRGPEAVD